MQRLLAAGILTVSGVCMLAIPVSANLRDDGASITNSGSTNAAGYRVDLWSTGRARVVPSHTATSQQTSAGSSAVYQSIDSRLTRKFFRDLKLARIAAARSVPCMKSASFGTRTTVVWHGWISPDLDCPLDGAVADLKDDAHAIASRLGLSGTRERVIRLPRNEPRAAPAMTPTPPQPTTYHHAVIRS